MDIVKGITLSTVILTLVIWGSLAADFELGHILLSKWLDYDALQTCQKLHEQILQRVYTIEELIFKSR